MTEDRRKNHRFDYMTNAFYVMSDGSTTKICTLKNISQTGATIETDCPLSADELIKIGLFDTEIKFDAKVVWCQTNPILVGNDRRDQSFTCGVKYKDVITEKVKEILEEIESRN